MFDEINGECEEDASKEELEKHIVEDYRRT
jgi:hypothetical protein